MQGIDVVRFETGRDGRPVARKRGLKIMIPVSGITPQLGRWYRVQVIRDTRPGEQGGALLVEVLEDLDAKREAEIAGRRLALAQHVAARIGAMGLTAPSAEAVVGLMPEYMRPYEGCEERYTAELLPRLRRLVQDLNPAPVPPDAVVAAARAYVACEDVPLPEAVPTPPGWHYEPETGELVWWTIIGCNPWRTTTAVAVEARIDAAGRRTDIQGGYATPHLEESGLSPDEMRTGCKLTYSFQPGRTLSEAERADALTRIPWPTDAAVAAFWQARRAYEAALADARRRREEIATARHPHERVLLAWAESIGPGGRYLLGLSVSSEPAWIAQRVLSACGA